MRTLTIQTKKGLHVPKKKYNFNSGFQTLYSH